MGWVVSMSTIEQVCRRFVRIQLRHTPGEEIPWKVLRSCASLYFRACGVDKGEPGVMNRYLRETLDRSGFVRSSKDTYDAQLAMGSWPIYVDTVKRALGAPDKEGHDVG